MSDTSKLYAERRPMELEPYYSAHMLAMTVENLRGKSEIAEELAFRDKRIAELEAALRHERTALSLVLERQRQGDRCTVSVRDLQQGISLLDAALAKGKP